MKYFFRENGCGDTEYLTPFLGQIRRGIKNTYPPQANKRKAFLLPHFLDRTDYIAPGSKAADLARLATVLGFIGMLRPHTFAQLRPASFTFVLRNDHLLTTQTTSVSFQKLALQLSSMRNVLGFYITFRSKTMAAAQAYFPNLSSHPGPLKTMCPLTLLLSSAK